MISSNQQEQLPKPVKERDSKNLLELVCQLHTRCLCNTSISKEVHDAYVEARNELESRLEPYTPPVEDGKLGGEVWKTGFTIINHNTAKWTKAQIDKNNETENRMVFENFHVSDMGRSRRLICTCATKEQADEVVEKYNAALKSQPSTPVQDGWEEEKPNKECVFVSATKYERNDEDLLWDYTVWQIKKLDGEDDNGNPAWYFGLLNGDGEEWGPLEDLSAHLYKIIPSPPVNKQD